MGRIVVNILDRFKAPRALTDLVVLKDSRNYIAEYDSEKYLIACKNYAKKFGVYLIPSRFAVNGYIYMCLFSPEGKILGIQGATHLNLNLKSAFKQYDELNVIDCPLGKIFLCVDTDIYHGEVISAVREMGAELIVSSQFINSYEYNDKMLRLGVWNAAQSGACFVLSVSNMESSLLAPCDLTRDLSGYSVTPTNQKNLIIKIFTGKLQKPTDLAHVGVTKNRDFFKRHYKQLTSN